MADVLLTSPRTKILCDTVNRKYLAVFGSYVKIQFLYLILLVVADNFQKLVAERSSKWILSNQQSFYRHI